MSSLGAILSKDQAINEVGTSIVIAASHRRDPPRFVFGEHVARLGLVVENKKAALAGGPFALTAQLTQVRV